MPRSELLQTHAHRLLKDLTGINRARILADMLGSAALGWVGLYLSANAGSPFLAAFFLLVSTLAAYRSQIFIHEVVHLRTRFPTLETAYNWAIGYVNRFPSFTYYPHAAHHSLKTFASPKDPEYQPMRGPSGRALLLTPLLLSVAFPWYKMLRYALLPLTYPFLPREKLELIFGKLTTLRFNRAYERPIRGPEDLQLMRREDGRTCAFTWLILLAIALGFVSWRFFLLLQLSTTIGCAINMYRALLNHRYTADKAHESIEAAMLDSISLRAAWWNELWAPLGLSYHCLHHLAPAIPYYNLRRAHERLWEDPELGAFYRGCSEPSFFGALSALAGRLA